MNLIAFIFHFMLFASYLLVIYILVTLITEAIFFLIWTRITDMQTFGKLHCFLESHPSMTPLDVVSDEAQETVVSQNFLLSRWVNGGRIEFFGQPAFIFITKYWFDKGCGRAQKTRPATQEQGG